MLLTCIVFIIGLLIGAIATSFIFLIKPPTLGCIEVDESDADDVKWKFIITNDVDFSKTKNIRLKVNNVSQK